VSDLPQLYGAATLRSLSLMASTPSPYMATRSTPERPCTSHSSWVPNAVHPPWSALVQNPHSRQGCASCRPPRSDRNRPDRMSARRAQRTHMTPDRTRWFAPTPSSLVLASPTSAVLSWPGVRSVVRGNLVGPVLEDISLSIMLHGRQWSGLS